MSGSAFTAAIRYCQEHDVSDLVSKQQQLTEAKRCSFDETPYGPLLTTVTLFSAPPHANREMVIVNPMAYLYSAFKAGGGFTELMKDRLRQHPNSIDTPWRLALYADEIVPGNPLAVVNARKVWAMYFAFLEFHPVLHYEDAWCPLITEPAVAVKTVTSGISQVFAAAIKVFFGSKTFDFRSGVQLQDPSGNRVRFYATLSMIIQDGAAHKSVFGCKGDAGIRMCMLCKNVVSTPSALTDADGTNLLVCSIVHESDCRFSTDAEVRGAVKRVAHFKATASKAQYELRTQAIGFSHLEHGLLQDPDLESVVHPVSQYCHDWMHGVFNGGIFNVLVLRFMESLSIEEPSFKPWERLDGYVKLWHWPGSTKFDATTADLFNDKRVKNYRKAGHIKCSASQGLSVLPVAAMWAELVVKPSGVCPHAVRAVLSLCDLVEALQASLLGITTPAYLRTCVRTCLQACLDAGFRDSMIPKFHWAAHYARHLEKFGASFTCWVHERKHRFVKRYASDILSVSKYSTSVLSEVISHQMYQVSQPDAFDTSIGLIS